MAAQPPTPKQRLVQEARKAKLLIQLFQDLFSSQSSLDYLQSSQAVKPSFQSNRVVLGFIKGIEHNPQWELIDVHKQITIILKGLKDSDFLNAVSSEQEAVTVLLTKFENVTNLIPELTNDAAAFDSTKVNNYLDDKMKDAIREIHKNDKFRQLLAYTILALVNKGEVKLSTIESERRMQESVRWLINQLEATDRKLAEVHLANAKYFVEFDIDDAIAYAPSGSQELYVYLGEESVMTMDEFLGYFQNLLLRQQLADYRQLKQEAEINYQVADILKRHYDGLRLLIKDIVGESLDLSDTEFRERLVRFQTQHSTLVNDIVAGTDTARISLELTRAQEAYEQRKTTLRSDVLGDMGLSDANHPDPRRHEPRYNYTPLEKAPSLKSIEGRYFSMEELLAAIDLPAYQSRYYDVAQSLFREHLIADIGKYCQEVVLCCDEHIYPLTEAQIEAQGDVLHFNLLSDIDDSSENQNIPRVKLTLPIMKFVQKPLLVSPEGYNRRQDQSGAGWHFLGWGVCVAATVFLLRISSPFVTGAAGQFVSEVSNVGLASTLTGNTEKFESLGLEKPTILTPYQMTDQELIVSCSLAQDNAPTPVMDGWRVAPGCDSARDLAAKPIVKIVFPIKSDYNTNFGAGYQFAYQTVKNYADKKNYQVIQTHTVNSRTYEFVLFAN